MRYIIAILLVLIPLGCDRGSANNQVVIYSSIDEPILRPLMQQFEKESAIHVTIVTDTEATKSAALVERLLAEKDRPQADVYWGNEIFHTINLAEQRVFQPYRPKSAEDIPAKWRGKDDLYTCVGLRVRMLAISTRDQFQSIVAPVHGLADLTNPALKGKIGICNPGFGTASGHIAAMDLVLGEAKFTSYMQALKANDIKLLGGNSEVADQVAAGALIAGVTDNDDIANAKAEGQPIEGILPDQGPSGLGTLLIPGTVALVKNAQHPDNAKKLIDFICRPQIEKELITQHYLAYSVRDANSVKAMNVDYVEAAHQMKHAVELALTILQQRTP